MVSNKLPKDVVVGSAVLVLKRLVQLQISNPTPADVASTSESPLAIVSHLARKIDDIRHAQARACVLWLVGQYAASEGKTAGPEGMVEWAPDILRKAAKTFSQEVTPPRSYSRLLASRDCKLAGVDSQAADCDTCRETFSPFSR